MPEFETTAQGCRLATSVGGVLTGRGADMIIIDDPLKPEEALSQAQRQAANEWFDHTLYSRLNDKRKGAIVLITNRLHEDDLAGHVQAQEAWEVVSYPAIAEEDETHLIETALETRLVTRSRGAALHPEREPLDMLEQIRRTIGEYNFAGQYQQAPAPQGGGVVQKLHAERAAGRVRPHRAELGHRQQGLRAQRFQRLHELGYQGQGPLPAAHVTPPHGISRIEARGARAGPGLRGRGRGD